MAETVKQVLIVTGSCQLNEGLAALMAAIPSIEVVGMISSAREAAQCACPDLVILDMSLATGSGPVELAQIRCRCPQTWCIVLTDEVRQQTDAESAGADLVLPKGYPAADLIAAVESLIAAERKENRP